MGVKYNRSHSAHAVATLLKVLMIVRLSKLEMSSENASTAFLLHEGSKAKVTAEINDWIEISFNEKKGWIRTNALERI